MSEFSGKNFVVRVDEQTARTDESTFFADLTFLATHDVRPIIVAPNASAARALVRTINR
ncbi:MAG: hypothetical protein GIW97_08490, partial [Candidatus Eremiobacteraeota bacterium]|nr:hypothetical protein [Candidatus Eremiobacteraeota bacterium]